MNRNPIVNPTHPSDSLTGNDGEVETGHDARRPPEGEGKHLLQTEINVVAVSKKLRSHPRVNPGPSDGNETLMKIRRLDFSEDRFVGEEVILVSRVDARQVFKERPGVGDDPVGDSGLGQRLGIDGDFHLLKVQ